MLSCRGGTLSRQIAYHYTVNVNTQWQQTLPSFSLLYALGSIDILSNMGVRDLPSQVTNTIDDDGLQAFSFFLPGAMVTGSGETAFPPRPDGSTFPSDTFAITMRFRMQGLNIGDAPQRIFTLLDPANNMDVELSVTVTPDGMTLGYPNNGALFFDIPGISDGEWHTIAIIIDGRNVRLFMDCPSQPSQIKTLDEGIQQVQTTGLVAIGHVLEFPPPAVDRFQVSDVKAQHPLIHVLGEITLSPVCGWDGL